MHKRLPDPHWHLPGSSVLWHGGRYELDFADADDGRLWFGQCVGGWRIYRALVCRGDVWSPAPMSDASPDALRWLECEHCDGRRSTYSRPSKAQVRAAKVAPHIPAINEQLVRLAQAPAMGPRHADGRALYPCSDTIAVAGLVTVQHAQGRPRIDKRPDEPGAPLSRSLKVRDERDNARALPPQSSRDLFARANADHDEPRRRFYARAAQRQGWQEYLQRVAQQGRNLCRLENARQERAD